MKKMIKTKFRFFSFLLILLAVFFAATFSSCENAITDETSEFIETQPTTETVAKPEVSNKGSIQIRINPDQIAGSSSRTVLPEISYDTITRVVLSGTHNGSTRTLQEWSSYYDIGSVLIELGSWDLTLTVVNNGKTFTSETETVEVVSGTVTPVSFTLSTSSTEGGISLYVEFEGDAVAASYRLLNFPTETVAASGDLTVATNPTKSVTFTRDTASNPVTKGTYRIEIKFYAAGDILLNTYSEIVRVKGGFTSSASRYIDLNNLYNITYDADGGSILTGSYVEKYSLHSGTIDLPTLRRTGYEFVGWYKDSGLTDGPFTEFNVNTETSLTDKNFYAKWNRVCAITYYLANQAATADSDCIELTEDQCEEWGLVQSHTQGHETELPLQPIENENGVTISLAGYTMGTISGTGTVLTSNGSNYIIPATVTTDTDIYVSVKSHIAYIDPATGNDSNFAFNPTTPAETVAGALKWLKNADSDKNPVLYVKSAITSDIGQLTGLSLTPGSGGGQYGGAILMRDDSFTNDYLLKPSSGTITLNNITIDGGADWRDNTDITQHLAETVNVNDSTNVGTIAEAGLIKVSIGVTLKMQQNVTIKNNDCTKAQNAKTIEVVTGGVLDIKDCTITQCQADVGGAIWSSGKIIAYDVELSYNHSNYEGGALYATNNSNISFEQSSFLSNYASMDGGAIYNMAGDNPLILDQITFSDNNAYRLATILYNAGNTTFKGPIAISDNTFTGDNTFYLDNGTNHPIVLDSNFEITVTTNKIKLKPTYYYAGTSSAPSFTKQIFNFSNVSTNLATVKGYFELDNADYIIDDSGIIKLIPGTVTTTPGFPGNYVCKWKQRVNGTTRYIDLIIEDLEEHALEIGTAVGNINSVTAGIYEGSDLVKEYTLTSATGLSFAYPSYLDPPSGTPFYVKFNVKVDDTTAYSYDYWPEQFLIGSKPNPDAVGDIVFNDGSAMAYTDFENITDTSVKNTKKAFAIALIFYKGTSESDVLGVRTLGVGLKHNQSGLAWCLNGVNAYSKNITTIQCTPSGSAGALTYTGDKDGSNNLEQIEDFEGVNDTTTAANYPAFYFGKNYATNTVTNIEATSEFATGWYLPSIAELFQIYACRVDSIIGFDIGAASQALGGDSFGTSNYWSSSQSAANDVVAYKLNFHDGDWEVFNKGSNLNYVCCIRAF